MEEHNDDIEIVQKKITKKKKKGRNNVVEIKEMKVRIHKKMEELANRYKVKMEVVYHALLITSGNFLLAERYLRKCMLDFIFFF